MFDVAMIPFVINNITLSTSPLKLYEYLAGGKPVITTPMPECESIPEVHIAQNAEEFSRSLDLVKAKGLDKRYRKRVRALAQLAPTFAWYRAMVLTRTTALFLYDVLARRGPDVVGELPRLGQS